MRSAACLSALGLALFASCGGSPQVPPGPTVYWDSYGVADIVADNLNDAMFAMGYVQAKNHAERMAQSYKFARGRMAEVQGRTAMLQDGLIRGLGLEDAAIAYLDKMSAEDKAMLQNYCDGANKALKEQASTLAKWIEPFTIVDVLAMAQLANIAFPLEEMQSQLGFGSPGSNQFAIAPSRTTTRHPILSLDPHLGLDGEDGIVWQEVGIYIPGIQFRGICIPGLPIGIAGHTDRIAWSVTNNDPALYTLYTVKTNPQNANQYNYHGQWKDFENRKIELKYLDSGKLTTSNASVRMTAWGPMIPLTNMAVRFAPVGDFSVIDEVMQMARAKNVREFREAMKPCGLSMWNFTVADVEGNIAYQYNAHLPRRDESIDWRKKVDGSLPNSAWKDELWTTDELPHAMNPSSGILVNCNSAPWLTTLGDEIPKLWPNYVTTYGHTSRYDRLAELLQADRHVSPEKAMDYATDTQVPCGKEAGERLALYGDGKSAEVRVMKRWDGRADADSVGPALYAMWMMEHRSNAALAAEAKTGIAWTADQVKSAEADLQAAGMKLKASLGSVDIPWGKMLRLVRGKKEVPCGGFGYFGGASAAVRPTTGPMQTGGWCKASFGSSTRMIVSLEPRGIKSWSVIPYGNSEVPTSPHFADQMEMYATGQYKSDPFGVDAVKRAAKETLHLSRN